MTDRKIVIMGTAPSSVALAPFQDPSYEIWGCSPGLRAVPNIRLDTFFEVHRIHPGATQLSPDYIQFLKDFPGEVWMPLGYPGIQNCKVLPIDELVAKYSPYFFTSTIAWMLAMAIEQKPKEISLFGVDMSATEEYGYQRAGCQYFMLLAKSLGIDVYVPPESDLLKPSPLYGVCQWSHNWIKQTARIQEMNQRITQLNTQKAKTDNELSFLHGAMDDLRYQLQTFHGQEDTIKTQNHTVKPVPALAQFGDTADISHIPEHGKLTVVDDEENITG